MVSGTKTLTDMKKVFKFFAAALAIVAAVSCAKELSDNNTVQTPDQELVHKVFSASLNVNSGTKTTLNTKDNTVHWTEGDVIKVIPAGLAAGNDFSIVSIDGTFADFEGETVDADSHRAVYPASSFHDSSSSDVFVFSNGTGSLNLQYAVEGDFSIAANFNSSSNFAVSSSSQDGHLYFNNINAYLKFNLSMDNASIIEVSSSRATGYQNGSLSSSKDLGGVLKYDVMKKTSWVDSNEIIAFMNADGSDLKSGVNYYIAFPAVQIENLNVVIKDKDGRKINSFTRSTTLNALANNIYNLGTLDAAPTQEPVKVGDYFYSDGTYSTALDSSKEVVGIVFFAGNPKDEFNDTELPSEYCNGLAIGTKTFTTAWYDAQLSTVYPELDLPTTNYPTYNTGGYSVKKMWENKGVRLTVYNNTTNGNISDNTSGWYLPVINEWGYIFANLNDLNAKLSAVNADQINIGSNANVGSFWLPLTYSSNAVKIYTDYYKKELKYKTDWQYTSTSMARPIFAF